MSQTSSNGVAHSSHAENPFEKALRLFREHFEVRHNPLSGEFFVRLRTEPDFQPLKVSRVRQYLRERGCKINKKPLEAIIKNNPSTFNPIEDYFRSLPRRPATGYVEGLARYFRTADDPARLTHHLRKHLIRSIRCALHTDYQNQHAFILKGQNHEHFHRFIEWLLPVPLRAYQTTGLPLNSAGRLSLARHFAIILNELTTEHKKNIARLRSYMSLQQVDVRPPLKVSWGCLPRIATLWGSTDQDDFYTYAEGNHRFLIFEVEALDPAYATALEPDLLWAEAYAAYRAGEQADLTAPEVDWFVRNNLNRIPGAVRLDDITRLLEPADSHSTFMPEPELALYLAEQTGTQPLNLRLLGSMLATLGFRRERKKGAGGQRPPLGYYVRHRN
jgi:hypothetical protein